MEKGKYTNDAYIPLGNLEQIDSNIYSSVKEYRSPFTQILTSGESLFKLIETPELIKQRFVKNVYLAKILDIEAKDNDFILELALAIVEYRDTPLNITREELEQKLSEFRKESNDLTIITTWVSKNINNFLPIHKNAKIRRLIPDITKKDELFIDKNNKINNYYSINDYTRETGCSYETARSSLERLVTLQLFEKEKKGKRFIYKPTNKLQSVIKGGAKWI